MRGKALFFDASMGRVLWVFFVLIFAAGFAFDSFDRAKPALYYGVAQGEGYQISDIVIKEEFVLAWPQEEVDLEAASGRPFIIYAVGQDGEKEKLLEGKKESQLPLGWPSKERYYVAGSLKGSDFAIEGGSVHMTFYSRSPIVVQISAPSQLYRRIAFGFIFCFFAAFAFIVVIDVRQKRQIEKAAEKPKEKEV